MTHRIGIIGCGAIAQNAHIPGYVRANCTIAAIADPRPEVLAELRARNLPTPTIYPDHQAMLAAERLDAVSICTPNVFHAPIFLDCVGKVARVLLEKPVAIDLPSALAMQAAARRHGTQVTVALSHRFSDICRCVHAAVTAGRVGRPYHLRVRFAHTGPIPGWARTDWFHRPELAGGGALLDMGIHAFDLVRWLAGDATAVIARTATLRKPIAVDDNAVAVLEIGQDCLATVEVGWTSPAGFVGVEVMGDAGAVIADYAADRVELVTGAHQADGSSAGGREVLYAGKGTSGWERQMADFTAALSGEAELAPSLEEGVSALKVALAAAESSRRGVRSMVG
jgi:UDP-N-acetylglucosamine 3-dehydrogenase